MTDDIKFNLHTHCSYCDGQGEPRLYVTKAIQRGFKVLGFTSHAPLSIKNNWALRDEFQLSRYINEIKSLKKEFSSCLEIYVGLEVDYLGENKNNLFHSVLLDYMIGAVHYFIDLKNNKYYGIDSTKEEFLLAFEDLFNRDCRKMVNSYYDLVINMVDSYRPSIVGHLDLLKKHNTELNIFSEKEIWYSNKVQEALLVIKKNNCIVEVNTGGMNRGYLNTVYPSPWILRKCKDIDIPVTISSDAHKPEHIDKNFHKARAILKDLGFRKQMCLQKGHWVEVPL